MKLDDMLDSKLGCLWCVEMGEHRRLLREGYGSSFPSGAPHRFVFMEEEIFYIDGDTEKILTVPHAVDKGSLTSFTIDYYWDEELTALVGACDDGFGSPCKAIKALGYSPEAFSPHELEEMTHG